MSDINVTPFVDVMLVLLIVFMVSAPLLTVGVPLELPQSQAKALQQNNEPLTVSVTSDGQVFLQKDQVSLNDLIPKLKAIMDARGNNPDETIYVRGDKKVDYGTLMRVMGRRLPQSLAHHRGRARRLMKPGMTISCAAHAVALGLAVVAISAQPMNAPPVETLATQIVSEKDFSQMTKGVKNAQQLKIPDLKPLADKVDQEKSVDQLAPKAADKPAITTPSSAKSEPKPDQPKPDKSAAKADSKPDPTPDPKPEDKAEPKPDPKPEQKQADKPKTPDYKPDQIAKLLKKDAAKEPKANDNSAQLKQDAPKFDANQVAQLLNQEAPRRQLAAASQLNDVATLGAATGAQSAQLSQSEIDALKARLSQCWNPPAGITANSNIYVSLRVLMRQDGSLAAPPVVVEGSPSALGPALAESAKRALLQCQPFTMLRPEHYQQWKDLQLDFNPHELLGG
jgi:colicin import membrane protein